MEKLTVEEQFEMQRELQAHYAPIWGGLGGPEDAVSKLLWAIAEAGEAAQVIKKHGNRAILRDGAVRREFIEEMTDVAMYLSEVLLCYGVTAEEYTNIYREKHARNMHRWDDRLPGE